MKPKQYHNTGGTNSRNESVQGGTITISKSGWPEHRQSLKQSQPASRCYSDFGGHADVISLTNVMANKDSFIERPNNQSNVQDFSYMPLKLDHE